MSSGRFNEPTSKYIILTNYISNCWCILAPMAIFTAIMYAPIRYLKNKIGGAPKEEPEEAKKIEVRIVESKSQVPKDEILLIHGFPDSGEIWNS